MLIVRGVARQGFFRGIDFFLFGMAPYMDGIWDEASRSRRVWVRRAFWLAILHLAMEFPGVNNGSKTILYGGWKRDPLEIGERISFS